MWQHEFSEVEEATSKISASGHFPFNNKYNTITSVTSSTIASYLRVFQFNFDVCITILRTS